MQREITNRCGKKYGLLEFGNGRSLGLREDLRLVQGGIVIVYHFRQWSISYRSDLKPK